MARNRKEGAPKPAESPKADPFAEDFRKRLGVKPRATRAAVQEAYDKLVKVYHPDVQGTGNEAAMQRLNEARDALLGGTKGRTRAPKVPEAASVPMPGAMTEFDTESDIALALTAARERAAAEGRPDTIAAIVQQPPQAPVNLPTGDATFSGFTDATPEDASPPSRKLKLSPEKQATALKRLSTEGPDYLNRGLYFSHEFVAADVKQQANDLIDGMKRNLYAKGISPAEVSQMWQKARLAHDRITAAVERYGRSKAPAEQARLEQAIRADLHELRMINEYALPEQGRIRTPEKASHEELVDVIGADDAYDQGVERRADRLVEQEMQKGRDQRRLTELKAQIAELEGKVRRSETGTFKTNLEPDILRMEDEVRTLERSIAGDRTPKETKEEGDASRAHLRAVIEDRLGPIAPEAALEHSPPELHGAKGGAEAGVAAYRQYLEDYTHNLREALKEKGIDYVDPDSPVKPHYIAVLDARAALSKAARAWERAEADRNDSARDEAERDIEAAHAALADAGEKTLAAAEVLLASRGTTMSDQGSSGPTDSPASPFMPLERARRAEAVEGGESIGGAPFDGEPPPMEGFKSPLQEAGERLKAATTEEEKSAIRAEMAQLRIEATGAGAEREALLAAEKSVIDTDAEVQRRGILGRLQSRFDTSARGERKESKDTMNQAALEYARALNEHLPERIAAKGWEGEKADKVADRYRRTVAYRDVIGRSEEARAAGKREAMSAREASITAKALHWFGERNAALDKNLGKVGARIVRVALSSALGASVIAIAAPASGALGLGAFGMRVGRGLIGSFGGAAVGYGAGSAYEKTLGVQAKENLKESRKRNVLTPEDIVYQRRAYRAGNDEAIAHNRRLVETGAALMFGAGSSYGSGKLAELWAPSTNHLPSAESLKTLSGGLPHVSPEQPPVGLRQSGAGVAPLPPRVGSVGIEPPPAPGVPRAEAVIPPRVSTEAALPRPELPSAVPHPEAPVLPHAPLSVEARPGYGAETMIRELSTKLAGEAPHGYPPGSDASKLLEAAHAGRLNTAILEIEKKYDFIKPDGSSMLVGKGAHMSFDASGNIAFENAPGVRAGAVTAAPEAPRAVVHSPADTSAAELNRAELARIRAGQPPTPPPPVRPEFTAPFTNRPYNVAIDPRVGGVYMDTNGAAIAYANDYNARMSAAEAYAWANRGTTVWVETPEPVFYQDQWVPQAVPVRHGGFFKGLFRGGHPHEPMIGRVNPNTFTRRLR